MRWTLFWSSLWLLGCWGSVGTTLGWFGESARVMALLASVGLFLVWPVARLSEFPVRGRGVSVFFEAMAIVVLFQFVLWPLMILGRWDMRAPAWMTVVLTGWGLVTAASVWVGRRGGVASRVLMAVVLCVVVLLWPMVPFTWRAWSPMALIWRLSG